MAINGENNITKNVVKRWVVFWGLAVIVFTWFLMPVTQANAETRKWKVNNQITQF